LTKLITPQPRVKGQEGEFRSHYWKLSDIAEEDSLHVDSHACHNRLIDFATHDRTLFEAADRLFKDAPLGIHSLAGHFRTMEKSLKAGLRKETDETDSMETNQVEAEQVSLLIRSFAHSLSSAAEGMSNRVRSNTVDAKPFSPSAKIRRSSITRLRKLTATSLHG